MGQRTFSILIQEAQRSFFLWEKDFFTGEICDTDKPAKCNQRLSLLPLFVLSGHWDSCCILTGADSIGESKWNNSFSVDTISWYHLRVPCQDSCFGHHLQESATCKGLKKHCKKRPTGHHTGFPNCLCPMQRWDDTTLPMPPPGCTITSRKWPNNTLMTLRARGRSTLQPPWTNGDQFRRGEPYSKTLCMCLSLSCEKIAWIFRL